MTLILKASIRKNLSSFTHSWPDTYFSFPGVQTTRPQATRHRQLAPQVKTTRPSSEDNSPPKFSQLAPPSRDNSPLFLFWSTRTPGQDNYNYSTIIYAR